MYSIFVFSRILELAWSLACRISQEELGTLMAMYLKLLCKTYQLPELKQHFLLFLLLFSY